MAPDDLNAPLGQGNGKKRRKLPAVLPQLLAGALALLTLIVIGWVMFAQDPLGGQPTAVVATTLPKETPPSSGSGESKAGQHHDGSAATNAKTAASKPAALPPGSHTITIIDGSSGKRQNVIVPGNGAADPKQPLDNLLTERTHDGSIPRIAPDGTRPFTRYASRSGLPANRHDAPRIAIVVGDLGISASATAEALAKLPPAITFALSPYGNDVDALAARTRTANHELLLQVPMEPLDYPNNDPGPHTLLTTLAPAQNIERLHWLMARFTGYVGLANYMGERFISSETSLSPILHEAAKRGLMYFDDNSSPRSVAAHLAGGLNLPFAKADIVLDAVPTSEEIDRALARLELMARQQGTAVGYASAELGAIARIADWAKTVESRGFALVPITMIAAKAKSS